MAVEVLRGDAQTASSDLESLMYSFLYVATQGKLPWGPMTHDPSSALYAKLACMTDPRLFDAKVVYHIGEPRLKAIAKNLRGLLLESGMHPLPVQVGSLQRLRCLLEIRSICVFQVRLISCAPH